MFHVPNEYRIKDKLKSTDDKGNNGAFLIKHQGYELYVIASDGLGWEHVSVHINRKRCPLWEQMCFVKDLFWDKEDIVVEYHPPESKYINNHPYVLHLWRKIDYEYPLPEIFLV